MRSRIRTLAPFAFASLTITATLLVALQFRVTTPVISDLVGYVQASHQLARGEGLAFDDPHNAGGHSFYTLFSFKVVRPSEPNRYFSYAPGLPYLSAGLERLARNPDAVYWLVPGAAALLVALTFLAGLLLFDAWAGLWAAAALVAAPVFLHFATAPWSEIPGAAAIYLGCLLLLLSFRRVREGRVAVILAASGGLAAGASFFVRASNASMLLALPVIFWAYGPRRAFRDKRLPAFTGALLLSLAGMLVFNAGYYGGPLITGYSPLHGWYDLPAFSWRYAIEPSFAGGYSLQAMGLALVRQFRWLWLFAVPVLLSAQRRVGLTALGFAAALLLPYVVYAFPAAGENERFIIPAVPAVCLVLGQGVTEILALKPKAAWRWAAGLVALAGLVYPLPSTLATLVVQPAAAQAEVARAERTAALMEPNAVAIAYSMNDLLQVYGHRSVLNYRHMPPYDPGTRSYDYAPYEEMLVGEVQRLRAEGVPVYFVADTKSPPYKTDQILRRHFQLEPLGEAEAVYRVEPRP